MTRPTVLVVEDDPAIRRGLVDALTFARYEVLECADGDQGLATALAAEIDLLLLDVVLPGPNGFEILARLGVEPGDNAAQTLTTAVQTTAAAGDLVGRDEHMRVLHKAFGQARSGGTEVVFVHGRSGMGKSELVSRFLAEARDRGALVLTARCYERVWVPFKAVDP